MRDSRRTRVVLALLLLTAFTLITLDYRSRGGGFFGSIRRTASSVFGPVERVAADAVRPVRHAVQAVGDIGSNHKRVTDLQKEVATLQQQLKLQPFDTARENELEQLLHVSAVGQYKLLYAQVIAVSARNGFEWTATIDAGSSDGLKANMTVLNGDGLVGRLKIVGSTTSTVLLAIDPEFNVGVRLPNNAMGIVSGHGRSAMSLEMLDPAARVKVGDGLVTQGSLDQTPFVWGVPVGSVISATNPLAGDVQTGQVKPYVDFSTLDLVGIVVEPPRVDPREALLAPPLPTVTVTTTATATATVTASPLPSFTPTLSFSSTPSATPTSKVSPKPTVTPSVTPTPPKPSVTPTSSPATPTRSVTPTASASHG
ncbi:MAG TPA: rod shape-determining protein MreC [Acidothermaceae bacterium]